MPSPNSSSSVGTPSSSTSTSSMKGTYVRKSSSPARGRSQTLGSMDVSTSSPLRVTGESPLTAPVGAPCLVVGSLWGNGGGVTLGCWWWGDPGVLVVLVRLRPLDLEFMRRLSKIVNVVPVIAKADTLTLDERAEFKQRVRAGPQ